MPDVVGMTVADAEARLALQPLDAKVIYRPAKPLQRPGVVIRQLPRYRGKLSSHGTVYLFLAKAYHGVVPDFAGLTLTQARLKAKRLGIRLEVGSFIPGRSGRVVFQRPGFGGAAQPGMVVTLALGRG